MARFLLQNNYFEFNGIAKQHILGTAISTKFAPMYACIFMDKLQTDFLNRQEYLPLVWYILMIYISFGHTAKKKLSFFSGRS